MKMKLKSKLIALFVLLAALFMLAGCSISQSLEEMLAERNLVAKVTYYANGGTFDDTAETKQIWFPNGATPLDIGNENIIYEGNSLTISHSSQDFVGWYKAVLDEETNLPKKDADGKYLLGEKADFSSWSLSVGEEFHLIASWTPKIRLVVLLACDEGVEIEKQVGENEKPITFTNGSEIYSAMYGASSHAVSMPNSLFAVKDKTHTLLEYYYDEKCTQIVEWPVKRAEDQTENAYIYAKYIEGDWKIVKTANDVSEIFKDPTRNYWVFNDIDMADAPNCAPMQGAYANRTGTIEGNNHTISNLSIYSERLAGNQIPEQDKRTGVSMFGWMTSTAVIKDISFENVSIRYETNKSLINIGFVCSGIDEGATFSNVRITGKLEIDASKNSTDIHVTNYGMNTATDPAGITLSVVNA